MILKSFLEALDLGYRMDAKKTGKARMFRGKIQKTMAYKEVSFFCTGLDC